MTSKIERKHKRWLALINESGRSSGNTAELEEWASKNCGPGQIYVPGYRKENGEYVHGYCKHK